MKKVKKKADFWRHLTNFWTLILFVGIVYDFWLDNGAGELIAPIVVIYVGVLAIYAGTKEFERWHQIHSGRHPGEVFVILWTVLMILIIGADFFLAKPYILPAEIIAAYMSVLGVLAITRRSKYLWERKKRA